MKSIKVTFYYDNDSKSETVEVPIHHSLMEASKYYSKDNYIPGIDADCGGSCACCTCHVIVDDKWINKVGKMKESSAEQELLDYEHKATKNSRLACQIDLTEKLDGLWATCFQHELDHLNGKLFIDYLKPIKKTLIKNKIKKLNKKR